MSGGARLLQRPEQKVEPVVAEEHLAIAHKHRHAEYAARVGLARKFRQFIPSRRIERSRQRIGRQFARLRGLCIIANQRFSKAKLLETADGLSASWTTEFGGCAGIAAG